MKRLVTILTALTFAVLIPFCTTPVDAAGVCDPQRSILCDGLVDIWQFTDAGNIPSVHFGSFGDSPLFVKGGGIAPTSDTDKVGGTASIKLGQYAFQHLVSPRTSGFANGNWTVAAWMKPLSAGAVTTKNFTLFSSYANSTNATSSGFWGGVAYTAGNWRLMTYSFQNETGTMLNYVHGTNITLDAWHLVVFTMSPFGPYGKSQVCISIDNAAPTCGAFSFSNKSNSDDLTVGGYSNGTGMNGMSLDGFGIWGRTFDAADISLLWNAGAGRAFPFY